jgi:hypothetical protein
MRGGFQFDNDSLWWVVSAFDAQLARKATQLRLQPTTCRSVHGAPAAMAIAMAASALKVRNADGVALKADDYTARNVSGWDRQP